MNSNSFLLEDIAVGQVVDCVWQVTAKQIDQFSILSGDHNPLHVSTKYAMDNGYQDRVAHGFLFGAKLSGIIGMLLPGKRCLLLEEQLAFPNPIYPKDTIKLENVLINRLKNNCSKINFIDVNKYRIFPDVAMRDSDHLRRPGWMAEYARLLEKIVIKLKLNSD